MAQDQNYKVVLVGFPIQDGISYLDDKGRYTG